MESKKELYGAALKNFQRWYRYRSKEGYSRHKYLRRGKHNSKSRIRR
ncbi:hypothetical protein [Clostridium sp. Marseille-QA1073]